MSFISVDNTWSGKYANYIIEQAFYAMDTVEKGVVCIDNGIKKIFTIDRIDIQNPLSPSQAVPTAQPGSGWTIDLRTMTPNDFQTFQVANPRNLEGTVWSDYLADPILEEIIPTGGPNISAKMIQTLLGRCGESIETMFWQGSLAYAGHYVWGEPNYQLQYFNGFLQRMVNDPLVNISTLSKVTITNANILLILQDLLQQATIKYKALISDKNSQRDMRFLVSTNTWMIYKDALTQIEFKGGSLDYSGTYTWKGWEVCPISGMAENTVVFSRTSPDPEIGNFHVAMNSQKDWNLRIGQVDGNIFAESWAFLAKWKMDTNYGWENEIFLYTTLTPSSFLPPVVVQQ